MKKILFCLAAVLTLFAASCTSCRQEAPAKGYDYDWTVIADYDYIASQYKEFQFLEADVLFDTTINDTTAYVESIRTVFQCGDTCVMIVHNPGFITDTVMKVNDRWMECMPMDARNAVTLDSCLKIIADYRDSLNTRAMTFRRVLAPPFPENGQYIFGVGALVVDSKTGEIVDWNDKAKESGLKSEKK